MRAAQTEKVLSDIIDGMTPAFEEIPETIPPCRDSSGEDEVALWIGNSSHDSFRWRQFRAAGLAAVAEKVTAGHDLEMDDALALSRAGLSLLGQIVQLRPAASDACDMAADLPIDRVASRPESPRFVGQALANWQSFCQALIEMRSEVPPTGLRFSGIRS